MAWTDYRVLGRQPDDFVYLHWVIFNVKLMFGELPTGGAGLQL